MRYVMPDEGLKIFDIRFDVTTAGPSPNGNKRIELFLLGCAKAASGNPCPGCFNRPLWHANIAEFARDPEELADWLIERVPNNQKYITIGGGEPTDQIKHLIPFCRKLKAHGFHIMMYTWREVSKVFANNNEFRSDFLTLFKYIDMIVDGQFRIEECLYQEDVGDGFLSSIGSGNQIVWDTVSLQGYHMRDLVSLSLNENNRLIFKVKE